MSPLRSRRRRPRSSSCLLVALGALTGLAVGAVIADRVGGLDGLLKKTSGGRKKRLSSGFDHEEMALATAADHADVDHDYEDDAAAIQGTGFEYADEDEYDDDDDADEESVPMSDDDDAEDDDADEGAGHVPDETELEERVLEAFHNDPVLADRAIDIGAIGTGVIELTGWVQASWEIGHAVTLARGVPDVTTVVDRLAVRDGEKRRDHSGKNYSGELPPTPAVDDALPRAD
ncbi:MAG: BON domain-containing protein [Gemmatimonadaceae bacterium]